jgi:hypothetical protein
MARLIEHVEPLLLTHGVDLALWGHTHAYQRHCASARAHCVQPAAALRDDDEPGGTADDDRGGDVWFIQRAPRAPVHMLVGTGGAGYSRRWGREWIAMQSHLIAPNRSNRI